MRASKAEEALNSFLENAILGKSTVAKSIVTQVGKDVSAAFVKQFSSGPRDAFKLRMSNLGKPRCQLWFEKNQPEDKKPLPPQFLMNMILGDIVEAVFKGLLRASKVPFEDNAKVTLDLGGDRKKIKGEFDMIMDGRVDDVKSASPWSYTNKFVDLETLQASDPFGYVSQLVGYSTAADKEVGGWWVINKANGHFKYVDANHVNKEEQLDKIRDVVDYIEEDKPFERCFPPIEETYYKKPSGNLKLGVTCGFCSFKHKCWPTLQSLPSKVSKASSPPQVDYILVA